MRLLRQLQIQLLSYVQQMVVLQIRRHSFMSLFLQLLFLLLILLLFFFPLFIIIVKLLFLLFQYILHLSLVQLLLNLLLLLLKKLHPFVIQHKLSVFLQLHHLIHSLLLLVQTALTVHHIIVVYIRIALLIIT